MKLRKNALFVAVLLASNICSAAVLPTGSRFDPRNQVVSYNPQNTTVINSAVGYTTTLVFDDDETVLICNGLIIEPFEFAPTLRTSPSISSSTI